MRRAPVTIDMEGRRLSLRANRVERPLPGAPAIVAIHGGGFTSAYFDLPGFSLLGRAEALGIPAVAIDRPGYGESGFRAEDELGHAANAAILEAAIGRLARDRFPARPGVVLVGHSIGGAIAIGIAARDPAWLLGVAVSGVGLRNMPGDREMWQSLPETLFVGLPDAAKDAKMFGPPGTHEPDAPARSHAAGAPAPRRELIDIVTAWPRDAAALLARVAVPVHYRQGEGDALWQVDEGEVAGFTAACAAAPWHDGALVRDAGHCIDFHHPGAAFQLEQLAFALKCGIRPRSRA